MPNELGKDGVRPMKFFFNHDSLTEPSKTTSSAEANVAMALEGRLGF